MATLHPHLSSAWHTGMHSRLGLPVDEEVSSPNPHLSKPQRLLQSGSKSLAFPAEPQRPLRGGPRTGIRAIPVWNPSSTLRKLGGLGQVTTTL